MTSADRLGAAWQALEEAADALPDAARRALMPDLAAVGARLLGAANLWRAMAPRLRRTAEAEPAEAARGLHLFARRLEADGGPSLPMGLAPALDAAAAELTAAWAAAVEDVTRLADHPEPATLAAHIERAELPWRRIRARVKRHQHRG